MHQTRYMARVQYQEFNGTNKIQDYYFFARDKDNARAIANELFKESHSQVRNVQIGIKYEKPTQTEVEYKNAKLSEVYQPLKQQFEGMDYKLFLKAFQDFDGWDFKKNYEVAEFMFEFQGFTCKAVCNSNICSLDEEELLYQSDYTKKVYVIRDDCVTFLIGN